MHEPEQSAAWTLHPIGHYRIAIFDTNPFGRWRYRQISSATGSLLDWTSRYLLKQRSLILTKRLYVAIVLNGCFGLLRAGMGFGFGGYSD
jgi:hypothetical protein